MFDQTIADYRKALGSFQAIQLSQLIKARHKGKREDWCDPNKYSCSFFIFEIIVRLGQLEDALDKPPGEKRDEVIATISADIANFCMMIADQNKTL